MEITWNPWHGCKKLSEGCANCYVYRSDARYERDSTIVTKTSNFNLPIRKARNGEYKIPPGCNVGTCFTSDFLLDTADEWRGDAWKMMSERKDLRFLFITKRIDRLESVLPPDWDDGYDNVTIGCTCENQRRADERLPIFLAAPIKRRIIICEPLIEEIDLSQYLNPDKISQVVAGGESGRNARICKYGWILKIHDACENTNIAFWFKQTGARLFKDGKLYRIERKFQHSQARKAEINIL